MNSVSYFGEITVLESRAVWYSDEEDDTDVDEEELRSKTIPNTIEPPSNETFRSNKRLNFKRVSPELNFNFSTCIISLASSLQYNNNKSENAPHFLGSFESFGKAFAYPLEQNSSGGEYLLWLLFDTTNKYICGQEASYFVENLREQLHLEFNINPGSQIIILSQQYSNGESLEYLKNFSNKLQLKLPFNGVPLLPPSIIKNHFESALFEQLTLSMQPAILVCLPSPKNFWFDKTANWPSIPSQIIEFKLNDDHLEKTLIFT